MHRVFRIVWCVAGLVTLSLLAGSCGSMANSRQAKETGEPQTAGTLDLRRPMDLAAWAIVRRLDPAMGYRPWFLLREKGGIPVAAEHAPWDLGDMTGRYLEGLILARRMGISRLEFSQAEGRLGRNLLKMLGDDGLVHDPASGAVDHSFSQGSALYGLVAWYEDSSDPAVRMAAERLVTGLLKRDRREGDLLVDPTVKLEQSSGSHLAGYGIYPVIRFYELTGYADALVLAEGLTRWVMADPTLAPEGALTKPLSWEGHIHSWLDALAGCARTARNSKMLDRAQIIARCRATYDWVRRTDATSFGETLELTLPLREYQTAETAHGTAYSVRWRGSSVLSLEPRGTRIPLYGDRKQVLSGKADMGAARYP